MSETPQDSLIPYDEIVQDALRAVVGRVLGQVEQTGLPGNHHFYITFKTGAPGVDIPRHLTERYPDEMTIVVQNRFWDLHVTKSGFEIGLSFNQVGSKLSIPFAAITAFHDPAVDFALHFSAQADDQQPEEIAVAENDPVVARPVEDGSNVVSVDFTRKK
ncbi:ClpXP protease specificity-enhancing factor SspB [Sphingomonas sp. BIUV-7]|uniref:ClpXP protease specificity-enhancing factor SspB n=1 Tax=Sphingomonas natans TaxID=3063330 RepID=A0ABT8Y970_9SPHN|nr:ClpXP protease specificity-enhancing factor SspB [Sphingomonas sp. BIUV-7]MDO6414874.1 ClpXP protease specificity-enhancing factor SspB [Sphingomonas sp. BIUV-7]